MGDTRRAEDAQALGAAQAPPERILLVIQHRENARLLAEWLARRFEVVTARHGEIPPEPFDLCIIDGPSLEAAAPAVRARKATEEPGFLPFLLVTTRRDLRVVNRYLDETIDELIFMPIEKVELQARIEQLLRARRATAALKRQGDDLFTALVEQASTGVYLCWSERYLYLNKAGADMFGYPPEEIQERHRPLELAHPGDRATIAAHIRDLESGLAREVHYTYRGLRRDGSVVHLEAFERRVTFRGAPARLGTLMDVTERARLEEERERLHDEQVKALRRADTLKDQFLSILSHELRTPLNAIQGFGSILEDELAGPLTPQQHAYLKKILHGSDVLLALVNDLLDMSRIQAGKFSLTISQMRLQEAIADVTGSLDALAQRKGQTLTVDVPADLPAIQADEQRVCQALTNLIGNAVKFTHEGGHIRVQARVERGRFLLIEIEDDGPGIAPDDIPRLFQRFTQLDMSLTRHAGGTGLGLSITKALVEAHGGEIGVRSRPGAGSTFWFTLPVR